MNRIYFLKLADKVFPYILYIFIVRIRISARYICSLQNFFLKKNSVILSFSFGIILCIKHIYILDRSFYLRKICHNLSQLIIRVKSH